MVSFSETLTEIITISNLKQSMSIKTFFDKYDVIYILENVSKMLFNGDFFGKWYLYKYMNKYTIICI